MSICSLCFFSWIIKLQTMIVVMKKIIYPLRTRVTSLKTAAVKLKLLSLRKVIISINCCYWKHILVNLFFCWFSVIFLLGPWIHFYYSVNFKFSGRRYFRWERVQTELIIKYFSKCINDKGKLLPGITIGFILCFFMLITLVALHFTASTTLYHALLLALHST